MLKDSALGAAAVIVAIGTWVASAGYPTSPALAQGLGAAFFPRLLAVMMGLFGLSLVVTGVATRINHGGTAPLSWKTVAAPVQLFVLLVVYFLLMPVVGFLLTTPLYLAAAMMVMTVRLKYAVLLGAVATGAIYVLFRLFLQVPLPMGRW